MNELRVLRARLAPPLTAVEAKRSDELFSEYCSRPQHASRLNRYLIASLRAVANRIARHGNPPNYNQRLAYRMHKKRKAKQLAIAIYGDPNEPDTQTLIDQALKLSKHK